MFLSAEFSRDLKDSFLWKFCSYVARVEEKVRDGTERRACRCVGVWKRGRRGARMSWREQEDAMAMLYALVSNIAVREDGQFPSDEMTAMASRGGKINFLG